VISAFLLDINLPPNSISYFSLQMKKRALKVTGATYTGLFNACANSPWPNDGLKRAHHLRELMFEKGYEPNAPNYHAMIKGLSIGHTVSSL
jgi:hypothetical protein